VISGVKVLYEGKTVEADQLDFIVEMPSFGRYRAEDGALIKVDHEILNIYRVIGQVRADGKPVYIITGSARIETTMAVDGAEPDGTQVAGETS